MASTSRGPAAIQLSDARLAVRVARASVRTHKTFCPVCARAKNSPDLYCDIGYHLTVLANRARHALTDLQDAGHDTQDTLF